jgi:peptidoglycan/xylan/chitin deacetylase (PgdA/CDA1 family)
LTFSHILEQYNMTGTFYVNTNRLNTFTSSQTFLTTEQVLQMYAAKHEIGGHTLTHANLTQQSFDQQKYEICQDRINLIDIGVYPTSFAFPFGINTDETFQILSECGYNSARDSGGIRTNTSCTACPVGERIPPQNPLQMRSVPYRATMGVSGIQAYITAAANETQDTWLMFIFHELGDYDPVSIPGRITEPELHEILTYIQTTPNLHMVTVSSNINATFQPMLDTCHMSLKRYFRSDSDMHHDIHKRARKPTTTATTATTTSTTTTSTTTTAVTTAPSSCPTTKPVGVPYIVFTFDHGTSDHDVVARILEQHGMRGVFMVNSANIGTPGFLSISQLQTLQSYGHEIGSKTKSNLNLLTLTPDQQLVEICNDRTTLQSWNLSISSIAWPNGANNVDVETMASTCGFGWGRDAGGLLTFDSCLLCKSSEELPFGTSIMKLRSFTVKSTHDLGSLMWQVWRAEERGTSSRALIFNFGTICDGCAFSPSVFRMFLVWLKTRIPRGTNVVTFNQLS